MKRNVISWVAGLCWASAASQAGAGTPLPMDPVPIEKCEVPMVAMTIDFGVTHRQAAGSEHQITVLNQWLALAKKYEGKGRPDQPVSDFMTKEEQVKFDGLAMQGQAYSFYSLAESRLSRDMQVLWKMHDWAGKERDGVPLPKQNEKDFDVVQYLHALRIAFKSTDKPEIPAAECSLDRALYNEEEGAVALIKAQLAGSSTLQELAGIKAKYGLAEMADIDPAVLQGQDKQRVPVLQAQLGKQLGPQLTFAQDVIDLRLFGDVIAAMYEGQKADILMFGGANTPDVDKARQARYEKLSIPVQQATNLWWFIDKQTPSDEAKNARLRVDAMSKFSTKK